MESEICLPLTFFFLHPLPGDRSGPWHPVSWEAQPTSWSGWAPARCCAPQPAWESTNPGGGGGRPDPQSVPHIEPERGLLLGCGLDKLRHWCRAGEEICKCPCVCWLVGLSAGFHKKLQSRLSQNKNRKLRETILKNKHTTVKLKQGKITEKEEGVKKKKK